MSKAHHASTESVRDKSGDGAADHEPDHVHATNQEHLVTIKVNYKKDALQ